MRRSRPYTIERDRGREFVRRQRLRIIHQAVSIGETGGPDRLEVVPGRPVSALRRAELFQRFPLNTRNERGDALQLRRRVNRGTDPRNWVTE